MADSFYTHPSHTHSLFARLPHARNDNNNKKDSLDVSGVNGWKGYIPGVKDDETIVSMQKQISVLDAMTEEELADYNRLRRREKLRVAESAGITVQDLNGLLGQYENAKVMHQWLIARRERGDSLPESMDEAQSLMQFDRRGISPKSFRHVKR